MWLVEPRRVRTPDLQNAILSTSDVWRPLGEAGVAAALHPPSSASSHVIPNATNSRADSAPWSPCATASCSHINASMRHSDAAVDSNCGAAAGPSSLWVPAIHAFRQIGWRGHLRSRLLLSMRFLNSPFASPGPNSRIPLAGRRQEGGGSSRGTSSRRNGSTGYGIRRSMLEGGVRHVSDCATASLAQPGRRRCLQ